MVLDTSGGLEAQGLRTLTTSERAFFNTLPAGAVVTVTPVDPEWFLDVKNEWLPALSRARSALVVQGYEWTDEWPERLARWKASAAK